MCLQVLVPCARRIQVPTLAKEWDEGVADSLSTIHISRGREKERAVALLVMPAESRAKVGTLLGMCAESRDYKDPLMS